jgi:zinc and cadmium transporter
MTQVTLLAFYAGAILVAALAGGALPLVGTARRNDAFLSFSAGVMLGAAFFHMLPEAVASAGMSSMPFVLVGFLFLFLLERFVLVHVCAEPGPAVLELAGAELAAAVPPPHPHVHGRGEPCEGTGCAVHTVGLAAFVGLSLHTMIDGFALGAASTERALGFLVFLAILAHKVPSSFSLSAILRAEGYSRRRALAMNAAFSCMVPLGAALYLLLRDLLHTERFTAYALAASAGTFLHLALSDILPDLHRRGQSKLKLSLALLVGVVLMWALRLVVHEP